MQRIVLATTFAIGLLGLSASTASAQDRTQERAPDRTQQRDRTRTDDTHRGDATYGRIKEITAGQKVVIDVDNAIDKTFELNDKDVAVNMDKELKVGDPVKVMETKTAVGKTRSVTITKHTGGGVTHGDKPAGRKP